MERQKVTRPVAPAYPARAQLGPAVARRAAIAAIAAPLLACSVVHDVDGVMAEPEEPWAVSLPAEGTHTVDLSDPAVLEYHLELAVADDVVDCLVSQEEALLEETDAVLGEEPAATFDGGADLSPLEGELATAIAAFCDAGVDVIDEIDLVVDEVFLAGDTDG